MNKPIALIVGAAAALTMAAPAHAADWGVAVEHGPTSCPGGGFRTESWTLVNESDEVKTAHMYITVWGGIGILRQRVREFTLSPGQQVTRTPMVRAGRIREYTVAVGVGLVESFSIAGCGALSQ